MNVLVRSLAVGPLETNCYIVADPAAGAAFIIDPGSEPERIVAAVRAADVTPVAIINTHGHWDHIGANRDVQRAFKVPLWVHRADEDYLTTAALNCSAAVGGGLPSPTADALLDDAQSLPLGGLTVRVVHTPGHTPGGICLVVGDVLLTGDTLFCGSIGRSDLPGGDEDTLLRSLAVFRRLPPALRIYPGHGPDCVLERELRHNPYLS